MLAAADGHPQTVKTLLASGALDTLNMQNNSEETALDLAIFNLCTDSAKILKSYNDWLLSLAMNDNKKN